MNTILDEIEKMTKRIGPLINLLSPLKAKCEVSHAVDMHDQQGCMGMVPHHQLGAQDFQSIQAIMVQELCMSECQWTNKIGSIFVAHESQDLIVLF